MKNTEKTMEKIVALCKNRGFVFPGSEIYGGLANTWDYGPLGAELKKNIKNAWWKKFVQENPYNVGLDCAILMNPQTWVASGHLGGFSDPLMDCRECHERFRADKLNEDYCAKTGEEQPKPIDAFSQAEMESFIDGKSVCCPACAPQGAVGLIPLPPGVFAAMRHIIYCDFEKLFGFKLGEENLPLLADAVERYLLCQVERILPALNFYKTICI